MLDEQKYRKMVKQIEELKREVEQAVGQRTQLMKSLKREFGCSTVKEGKLLLKKLEKERKQNEIRYKKALAKFEKEFESYSKATEELRRSIRG